MAIINFANAVMADGPVGYWRLGDPTPPDDPHSYPWNNIKDETANGNVGAVIDSIGDNVFDPVGGITGPSGIKFRQPGLHGGLFIPRFPMGDTAALFDGKTGRIIVLNSDSLNPQYLTMEALIRWDGPNPGPDGNPSPIQYQQRILEKSSYPEVAQYSLSINTDKKIRVELRVAHAPPAPDTWAVAESNAVVSQGVETYVAATYDGSVIQIYVNPPNTPPVYDSSQTDPNGPGTISPKPPLPGNLIESGVGIGNQTQRNRPFHGLIDEVALYPSALSADKILAHYRSQFTFLIPVRPRP
jgi:hypothetical protein